jgi:hypothetical protein
MALTARQERILNVMNPLQTAVESAVVIYYSDRRCPVVGDDHERRMMDALTRAADALGLALVDKAVAEEGEVQP